jgi:hypothetical protein
MNIKIVFLGLLGAVWVVLAIYSAFGDTHGRRS